MNLPKPYLPQIPLIETWISDTLIQYAADKIKIADLGFKRLPHYFSQDTLQNSYVIYTNKIPMPPLRDMGLSLLDEIDNEHIAGITYLDCFFVKQHWNKDESLHFHELIHIIQWRCLGPERFLSCYAHGLLKYGYRMSPLERMAYDHQNNFDIGKIYDVENVVIEEIKRFV